jgi:hypothetical protein
MPDVSPRPSNLETFFKYVSPLLAILTFAWGIYTFRITTELQIEKAENEAKRTEQTRRIEASKPFLEKQLRLFEIATESAVKIATSDDPAVVKAATTRFYELYWGELGLVERGDVANAMIAFKAALEAGDSQQKLQPVALRLAHACRKELAAAWNTEAWNR